MKVRFDHSRIKTLRTEAGLSQYDFGKAIGQPPQVISMYERGKMMPTVKVLARMADRYEKSIEYFFALN
jgi:transcriptional regulator with XRE-family HTH domain